MAAACMTCESLMDRGRNLIMIREGLRGPQDHSCLFGLEGPLEVTSWIRNTEVAILDFCHKL